MSAQRGEAGRRAAAAGRRPSRKFDLHLSLGQALGGLGEPEAEKHLQAAAKARPGGPQAGAGAGLA